MCILLCQGLCGGEVADERHIWAFLYLSKSQGLKFIVSLLTENMKSGVPALYPLFWYGKHIHLGILQEQRDYP